MKIKNSIVLSKFVTLLLILLISCSISGIAQIRRNKKVSKVVVVNKSSKKYSHLPKYYKTVKTLPQSHTVIVVLNKKYYFDGNIFYKPQANGFAVCSAPIGVRINKLPPRFTKIIYKNKIIYYHYGTYFRKEPNINGYVVVLPPFGIRVDELPNGYETVTTDSVKYYKVDKNYYKLVIDSDGDTLFEKVSNN
jgi:Family of unknown function (DUF6515)